MSFLYQFVILIGLSIGVISNNVEPLNNFANQHVMNNNPVNNPTNTFNNPVLPKNLHPAVNKLQPDNINHRSNNFNEKNFDKNDDNTAQSNLIIDETRSIDQLIVDYGYSFNKYYVTTSDGYILTIHRIKNPCLSDEPLDPIILGHPATQDGSIFIDGSPFYNPISCSTGAVDEPFNPNLGFLLADLGYDVFMPSFRGFRYSRNHTDYNPAKDAEYWDFTSDEMGKYDAPAIVDFVLGLSTYPEVIWIGHSLGVSIPLILLATQPSYEEKIRHVIGLAPTTFLGHTTHPSTRYWADSGLGKEKQTEFGPKEDNKTTTKRESIVANRASNESLTKLSRQYFYDFGYDPAQTNVTRLPVFYAQQTQTSLSTYVHFSQLACTPYFKAFDGGKKRNTREYGKPKPPFYKISQIRNVTFTIMASPNDKVAKLNDVKKLVKTLKAPVDLKIVKYKKMNHFGFLWSLNRQKLVNDVIVDTLNEVISS
ncbi:lipase member K [Tetranychus urticae]|uniref:AB hydrolase-1 domain-containing protein n=1 Tax=Tetranychus urticae TaxID=32264 RepID=T1KGT5_TETUR|nr:lipase member K [Tetranychus urticae]